MEQREITCIGQKLEKKRKKQQLEIFKIPSENEQLGLMRMKSQQKSEENFGEIHHESDRFKMEFVDENKRQKWEEEHQKKLEAGKGSNMDINVRIKRL